MMIYPRSRLLLLTIPLFLLGGCTSVGQMTDQSLPDHRPTDFTLGVVVFGDEDSPGVEHRPARYIVDADGYLRASVGAGSSPSTYPKITRRLSREQLNAVWSMLEGLDLGEPSGDGAVDGGGGRDYLIELRSLGSSRSWSADDSAGDFVGFLAGLAWIRE
jgi:hypothetical protein